MELTILILGILNFLLTIGLVVTNVLLAERTRVINDINTKSTQLENYMNEMLALMTIPASEPSGDYRSVDGKYAGRSLEELIQNIASGEGLKYDPNDPESLRKFFEQIIEQEELDDEDGDDDSLPWDKS